MKLHTLKINWDYFYDILKNGKYFEIRLNDRQFKVGDLIHFVGVDGSEIKLYEKNLYEITYILENCPNYGLMDGYCILAIQPVKVTYNFVERMFL